MLTVGVTLAFTVMVIFPDVELGLHASLEVTTQLTTSPLVNVVVVNVEALAPDTSVPLMRH